MSRSNQSEDLKAPVLHYLNWKGEISVKMVDKKPVVTNKHHFSYWDKEKKVNVEVSLPLTFIVLDILHTFKGFSEQDQAGFHSNEIRGTKFKTDVLRVKCGKNDAAEGLYADISDGLKAKGAKYCQSVYVLMKDGEQWVINNLQLFGASVGPFMEFCKNNDVMKCAITVKEFVEGTKGSTNFNMPVFKPITISKETELVAIEKDKELQKYLESYFIRQGSVKEQIPESIQKEHKLEIDTKPDEYAQTKEYAAPTGEVEEQVSDLPF